MNKLSLSLQNPTALPEASALPDKLLLLRAGENPGIGGDKLVVSANTLAHIEAIQRELGYDRIALDYEHNTHPGTVAYIESTEGNRPVAAFGRVQVLEGDLWLTELEWTPHGREHAKNYIDLSTVSIKDKATSEVYCITSVGLCRQGKTFDISAWSLPRLTCTVNSVAAEGLEAVSAALAAVLPVPAAPAAPALVLDVHAIEGLPDAVLIALGQRLQETQWLKEQRDAMSAALDSERAARAALEATVQNLTAQIAELKAQLATSTSLAGQVQLAVEANSANASALATATATAQAATAAAEKAERGLLLVKARLDGKQLQFSANAIERMTLDQLRDLVASAIPGRVPTERRTPVSVEAHSLASRPAADDARAARIASAAEAMRATHPHLSWSQRWHAAAQATP